MIAVNIFSLVCRNDPPIEAGECVAYSCKVCTSERIGASERFTLHPRTPSLAANLMMVSFRPETTASFHLYIYVLHTIFPLITSMYMVAGNT